MDLQLKGKTAFITGSTSGIGFATAKTLLKEGAKVIINGRTQETVNTAIKRLQEAVSGCEVDGIAADFLEENAVTVVIEQLGSVDILINNVGIYTAQRFFDTTDPDWNRQLTVNLMSGVRLSRAF